MTLHLLDAHQHLKTKGPALAAIIKIILVGLVPQPALAFEATLPTATVTNFVAPVQLVNHNLPAYDYSDTGNTVAIADPVTTPGDWPAETEATKLAFAPALQGEARSSERGPLKVTRPDGRPVPDVQEDSGNVVLEGEASFYSRAGCLGCDPQMIMANGQPLDDNALTMAIGANLKQYVGYHARVTSLATGQSVVAKITDTGGFYQARYGHRVADLTIATKTAIGMRGGVGQVRVEILL